MLTAACWTMNKEDTRLLAASWHRLIDCQHSLRPSSRKQLSAKYRGCREKECKFGVFIMVCVAIKADIGRHNGVMKLLADI